MRKKSGKGFRLPQPARKPKETREGGGRLHGIARI